jgi:hypothetical protein
MSGKPRIGAYLGVYGEAMPYYSDSLQEVDLSGASGDLRQGRWVQNDKGTVASLSLQSHPIEGQADSELVDWLIERINALASTFKMPALNAQETKPLGQE